MMLKSQKTDPLVRFALLYYNQTIFQKFKRTVFDQVAIDAKNEISFEMRPLMAELKFKMSPIALFLYLFNSIVALPPEGAFQMSTRFYHLWPRSDFR